MSAIEVRCPTCNAPVRLAADRAGQAVRCDICYQTFTAPAAPAEPPAGPRPVARPVLARPVRASAPADRPRERKRRPDRDPDRRPAKAGGRNGTVLLVSGAVAVFGLLAVAAVGAVGYLAYREVAWTKPPAGQTPTRAVPPPVVTGPETRGGLPVIDGGLRRDPPVAAVPADPIARVKASTVYVRCDVGPGQVASGTGFFAGRPGYVLTNAHVVGYGPRDRRPATRVEVVVDSGGPAQRVLAADVYGADSDADLALLKVAAGDGLPDPLPFGSAAGLRETEEVFVFGYPFGERLGLNVSVNKTTVSSLRREGGRVAVVQLGGGLNPGNSGGPVADRAGQVVGVSVAKLRGAQGIDFAIPAETAAAFVEDQLASGGRIKLGPVADAPAAPIEPKLPPFRPAPPPFQRPQAPRPGDLPRIPAPPSPVYTVRTPAAKEEVLLPGPVADACVGGGGRYLIFRTTGKRALAVFDIQQAKLAKEIPLSEDVAHIASGATRLVIVYPNAKLIQLWNLTTLARERSAQLPAALTADSIHQVCMGSASAGPLFVYLPKEKRTLALDLGTLKTAEVRWTHWAPNNAYGPLNMRVSPDGTLLVGWGGGWAGCEVATFRGGRQVGSNPKIEFWSGGGEFALPTADGRLVLTPWAVLDRAGTAAKEPGLKDAYLVPAVEPGFFLSFEKMGTVGAPPRAGQPPAGVAAYTDDRKRLFALAGLDELTADPALAWEKRVFYYPRSGLLVTLAAGNDRLVLRRMSLAEQLDRSGADYLLVTSHPPAFAVPGKVLAYTPEVRSKKGGVKLRLESGPAGMAVSADGKLTWVVPADFAEPVTVVLAVSDASGQEVFHTFTLSPEAKD